jgi:hypothetical protein
MTHQTTRHREIIAKREFRAAKLAPFVNRHNARSFAFVEGAARLTFVNSLLDEAGVDRGHYRELYNALLAFAA